MSTDFGILGPLIYYGFVAMFLLLFFALWGLMVVFIVGLGLDLRDIWLGRNTPRRFLS